MLKYLFSFEGRIRRSDYWVSELLYFMTFFIIIVFEELAYRYFSETTQRIFFYFFLIILFFATWVVIAHRTKRCHDRGNSGWFQLIPFYDLWMFFGDSQYGVNKYGKNPKGIGN